MDFALQVLIKQVQICELNLQGVNGLHNSGLSKNTIKSNLKDLKKAIELINKDLKLQKRGKIESY